MCGLLLSLVAPVALGCVGSKTEACSWGTVCPAGMVCYDETEQCVFPDQLAGCDGETNGFECSYSGEPDGVCINGLCVQAAWVIFFFVASRVAFRYGVRRYSGFGG